MADNVTIPDAYEYRGPIPGSIVATFEASETITKGALVACVAGDYRKVKMADASEYAIGWAQGGMVNGEKSSINLFNPTFKADVDAGSADIAYGGIISQADDGKVKAASTTTAEKIVGISFSDTTSAGGQVVFEMISSTPNPLT